MANKTITDKAFCDKVLALSKSGMSNVEIAKKLKVSQPTIYKAKKILRQPDIAPEVAEGWEDDLELSEDAASASSSDPVARLERTLSSLESLARQAMSSGNISGFATLQRVLVTATKELARIRPEPPKDPNEMPDMIAVAAIARAKLHDLVDRTLSEGSAPPKVRAQSSTGRIR